MEQDQLIYVWITRKENVGFNDALEANEEDAKSLIRAWISDYVGKYEDDLAVKKMYENDPAAKRQYEEDLAAEKLHTYADKMVK